MESGDFREKKDLRLNQTKGAFFYGRILFRGILKDHFDAAKAKMQSALQKISNAWGMLFRAVFIAVIGFLGYEKFSSARNVGDIPFAQMTLKDLLSPIFSIGIVIGCIAWFFNFPEAERTGENPWQKWSIFGLVVVCGLGLLVAYLVVISSR